MTPEAIAAGRKLKMISAELKEAERLYSELEGSKKSLVAKLKEKSGAKSQSAKEDFAYAHDDYDKFNKGLAIAYSNMLSLRRDYEIATLKWHALKRDEERDSAIQKAGA